MELKQIMKEMIAEYQEAEAKMGEIEGAEMAKLIREYTHKETGIKIAISVYKTDEE